MRIIKPDNRKVYKEYEDREKNMMDYMTFGEDSNLATWDALAKNFVLTRSNENLNFYVDRIMSAKLQAERKMRK